jgi:hypothetical protein
MTITAIPTRTVGSLGPTKVNRRAVSDPYKQADAAEWNLNADCIIHCVTQLGIESSPAWNSIQGILNSGDTFYDYTKFDTTLPASEVKWQSLVAAPAAITTARAGLTFTNDAAKDIATCGYYFNRGQTPYVRFRATVSATPDVFTVIFVNAAGTEGWGVVLETAGAAIRGFHLDAGVYTYTAVSTWVGATECAIEFWVAGNTLYVSKDAAAAVACGTVPATDMMLHFLSSAAGGAGSTTVIRNVLRMANWSA